MGFFVRYWSISDVVVPFLGRKMVLDSSDLDSLELMNFIESCWKLGLSERIITMILLFILVIMKLGGLIHH